PAAGRSRRRTKSALCRSRRRPDGSRDRRLWAAPTSVYSSRRPPPSWPHSGQGRAVTGEVLENLGPARALLLLGLGHLERDRQLRLALLVLECRSDHTSVIDRLNDPFGFDDLAIRARERETFLAVVGRTHTDPECATRAHVGLGEWCLPVFRVHPLHDVLRIGVGLPHEIARRVQHARERERPTRHARCGPVLWSSC